MKRDHKRVDRVRRALDERGLDAVLCTLPEDVLMVSGYWPVVGNALALATREGRVAVVAPEDEKDLAERGWADELRLFRPVSLGEMTTAIDAVRGPFAEAAGAVGIRGGRIGYEAGPCSQPVPYSALFLYAAGAVELISRAIPPARVEPACDLLDGLRAWLTPDERDALSLTCRIAERAFRSGAAQLRAGLLETEAAVHFRAPLSTGGAGFEGVGRADGFAWCMSGPNAAEARGAYARSRARPLGRGELVLVHCNSYADGYWSDITRTYCLGEASDRQRAMYEAVFHARAAALAAAMPGARGADVDRAAREVLEAAGYGPQFTHGVGHGVGFAAIDPLARPGLHPSSSDVLDVGMVFNIEPAIYLDGECGLRHCDVVALTDDGPEVLTPFQSTLADLVVP